MAEGSCGHTPYDRDQVPGCIICAQAEIERLQQAATGFEIATQRLAIERDACLRRLDENDDEIERLRSDLARVVIANAEVAKLNVEQAETIERLRAALLMMKHAYETDNRPNMLIVNEALRPGPQGQDRREVGGCKPEMPQRKSLESSPGRPLHHLIDGIIRDVCELPGYNSPEDQPELLQATCSELERILRNRLGVETAALNKVWHCPGDPDPFEPQRPPEKAAGEQANE